MEKNAELLLPVRPSNLSDERIKASDFARGKQGTGDPKDAVPQALTASGGALLEV
jgi:hypothetical protein